MKRFTILLCYCVTTQLLIAQSQELPLRQIPTSETTFTPGSVVARMIEGLGHRYYWATNGLTEKDLMYSASEDGRNVLETLQHLYGLSKVIKNGPTSTVNTGNEDLKKFDFQTLRKLTLENLNNASLLLRGKSQEDIATMHVVFKRNEQESKFPFWNMINGPIADAIYHTGQIVMMRRANGNPIHSGVNVFLGTIKE